MVQVKYSEEKLRELHKRVVEDPNKTVLEKSRIVCPVCGKKILMIPTLRVMNVAIENHVGFHKKQLTTDPIKVRQTAIFVRLCLMEQVLQQTNKTHFFYS
ncbi:MAG: hypothetical protein NWF04_03515 [Candidatus Bathyarchaeota archaeon]|nr:hypothetical protein [Candidatus Bathyarchaeota archaeon]